MVKMNLSVSNIGWGKDQDEAVYSLMEKYGFEGLEIAPTRIFADDPYDKLDQASAWADGLKKQYNFTVSSMQSIWFGRQEKLFGTEREQDVLLEYTKKAVGFAEAVNCKNLVFGCPRNRSLPDGTDPGTGITFFKKAGSYAAEKGTVISMEANPPVYHTNYINDTLSAFNLVETVDSKGFLLNLDVGTMIQNGETAEALKEKVPFIHHVHVSEPGLKVIEKRKLHCQIREILEAEDYQGYISIEMGRTDDLQDLKNAMAYVKEIFGS